MFNAIRSATPTETSGVEDAVTMLLGCHDRIRHFTGMAQRLAQAQSAPEAEVARAAVAVFRYFNEALPLHEEDENISLHPRLRRAAPAEELAGPAADAMVEQHRSIDQIVEQMLPLCALLSSNPAKLEEVSVELKQLSGALHDMFHSHLALEEETIFPAMRKFLSQRELEEIADEMRERRKR